MIIRISRHGAHLTQATVFLRWVRSISLGVGIFLLVYCGFVLLDARLYQSYQSRRFQRELESISSSNSDAEEYHPSSLPPAEMQFHPTQTDSLIPADPGGSALGRIEINAIGLEAMIMEGTDARTLRKAVGHILGTPLPGQQGNVAIAGHRDTFFSALRNIHEDDEITLTTLTGSFGYRVDSIKVVEANDTAVLDDSDTAILTLVTCYPFHFVGSAPKRFVVRAHRIFGESSQLGMRADTR
jgi:sortase A